MQLLNLVSKLQKEPHEHLSPHQADQLSCSGMNGWHRWISSQVCSTSKCCSYNQQSHTETSKTFQSGNGPIAMNVVCSCTSYSTGRPSLRPTPNHAAHRVLSQLRNYTSEEWIKPDVMLSGNLLPCTCIMTSLNFAMRAACRAPLSAACRRQRNTG